MRSLVDRFSEWGYYRANGHPQFYRPPNMANAEFVFQHDRLSQLVDGNGVLVEPPTPLEDLYKQRAKALRERYDYLVLMYSGGADSHQVLATFMKHGIPLDEVRTVGPLGFQVPDETAPTSPLGILAEVRRQAAPGVKLLQPKHVVVQDTTAAYTARWTEKWLMSLCTWPKPNGALYNAIRRNEEATQLQRVADRLKGKTVGVIYGSEKPYTRLVKDTLYLFFTDYNRTGVHNVFVHGGKPLYDPIMFYWGWPIITVKQAFAIKWALENSARARAYVKWNKCNIYPDTGIPDIDLSLIYPDWLHQPFCKVDGRNTKIISHFLDVPVEQFTKIRRQHFQKCLGADANNDSGGVAYSKLYSLGPVKP